MEQLPAESPECVPPAPPPAPLALHGKSWLDAGPETIDASQVDGDWLGHSYIAANKQILDDLFSAIVLDKAARDRNFRPSARKGVQYWILP